MADRSADQFGSECISTVRLVLTPLAVDDADEMASVLDDERLHRFIGGCPATASELADRYRRLVAGPKDEGVVVAQHEGETVWRTVAG